jgi:hypothetical protein
MSGEVASTGPEPEETEGEDSDFYEEVAEENEVLLVFAGFKSQSFPGRILTVAVGVIVWTSVYMFALRITGGVEVAKTHTVEGAVVRQQAAAAAGVTTGVYFLVSTIRAKGSPILNMVHPGLIPLIMPDKILTLFGEEIPGFTQAFSYAHPRSIEGVYNLLVTYGVGVIVYTAGLVVIIHFARRTMGDEAIQKWAERNVPKPMWEDRKNQ